MLQNLPLAGNPLGPVGRAVAFDVADDLLAVGDDRRGAAGLVFKARGFAMTLSGGDVAGEVGGAALAVFQDWKARP